MAEGWHYEEWQNKPKQGLNSESSSFGGASKFDGALNNEFKGALKFDGALNDDREEVDGREAYGPSFGYGDLGYGNLGYGPSLANMASSLKPTGTRRGVNWKRVTATPGVGQNGQANENKLAATMPGDKDVTNSDEKTALLAAAPAPNQPKSGAPGETQKPSGDLSFVIQLPEELKKLAPNQVRERLLILIMKQVFSLSDREATAEINAIGWQWQSLAIPSPKEMATGLFKILIDKKSYNTTLTRLYGRSTQDTENNPATTLERIERFSNSAGDLSTLMPQRVLTGFVNQIYNSQHPQNQLDPTRETHYGNPVWEAILDRLLHEQQLLKGLRDEIKLRLGGQGTFDLFPQYNQQFLSIARKLNPLSSEQIRSLKPLNLQGITSNARLITRLARQNAYKQELDAYDRYVEQETKNIGRNAAPERPPGTASGQQTPQQTHQQSSEGLLTISLFLPLTPQSQQAFTNAIVAVTAVDAVTARQILIATIEGPNGQSWMKSRQILQNPDGKPYISVTVDTKQLPQTKVFRQDTPADPSGNSDGIGVNPPLLEVVTGTKVTYFYYPGNSLIDRDAVRYSWHVLNDPQSVKNRRERNLSAPEQVEGPNSHTWEAKWDFPGLHTVVLRVQWPDGKITAYEYKQAVKEPQEILDRTFNQIPKYDYPGFRGGLEVKHLEIAQNGVSDQKFGTPHITSTAPNPAKAGTAPDYPSVTYSVVPSPNAKSYRWYVKPENKDWTNLAPNYNFNGYPRTQFQGQDVLSLESNSNSAKWLIASPGAYTIICEELDAAGQPLGTVARYLQVVQAAERLNQTEQFREYLGRVDSSIDKIAKDREGALRAVHLNTETSESTGLALFVGPDASDPKQIKLLDLTPGASRIEYGGADIEKAIDSFASDNSYPKGLIKLEIPGGRDRTIETRGQSFLGGVASKSGWASLGLAGLGFVALVTPGAQVAVPYLFLGAAAAGGVSSAASIANELQQAKPNGRQIAIDVLGLASSLAGGGTVSLALRGSGREVIQSVAGRFLIYTGFTSDGVAGLLLTVESVEQINQIVNTEGMSRSEKVTALVRILCFLAINYGLIAYGAKDLDLPSGNSAKQTSETGTNRLPNNPPVLPPGLTPVNPPSQSGPMDLTAQYPERTNTADREAQQQNQNQQTPLNSVDAQTGRQSYKGGVRGRDVYDQSNTYTRDGVTYGSLNAEKLKKVQNKITKPTAEYLHGAVVTHVSNGTQYTVNIPDPSSSVASAIVVRVEVIPTPTSNLSSPHAHHTSAGDESGPARLELKHDASGGWSATIEIDSALFPEDAAIVISHEINELVDIIYQHSRGLISSSFADQMEASVFRQGSTANTLTSHDRAAVIELRALYEDLSNLRKSGGSPDKQTRRELSISKQLDWMGLNDPVALDLKLKELRQAGVPEEGIRYVEMVGARAELTTHLSREAIAGHTGNSIMREELIRHLMYPEEQGNFKGNGIYGGHHTQRLLNFADDSDKYVMLERASKSAGGTNFRRFEQYRWKGTGSKPKPGDANFPDAPSYNPSDWIISKMPKTTADDIQVYLSEGADAWRNWLALYGSGSSTPYAITGKEFGGPNGVPPAISTNGVEFSGFFIYDSSSNTWTVNTIFIEASWLP